ncbi:MAG: citrate (Si)-synthase [bacterium]|jgi:citrate synthase|nr:citrate (Si)-synthase [bacterium]
MPTLKEKLAEKIPQMREELKEFLAAHGDKVISSVSVQQVIGGMRGVKGLLCDTSSVDPDRGVVIRGYPILDLVDRLPEEIFYLLVTGDFPTKDEADELIKQKIRRGPVPQYVWDVIDSMPLDSHPMAMFNTAILVMQKESYFAKRYFEGLGKDEYWDPVIEDCTNILSKLPTIAAYVYRRRFQKGPRIEPDFTLDWGANFARMLGVEDPNGEFTKLMRLYMVLHCDHESGNVSAFTSHTVASALSDPYYALSAGLNGLAGPLHGLANQECLRWVLMVMEEFNGVPTDQQLEQFAWETLNSGKVIPGYGHAVLRVTDPRFTAIMNFGKEHCSADPVYQTIAKIYDVVPKVLQQVHKIKDPWPNVDAASGCLLYHYGITEFSYYTVLFSVSRALGICAQMVLSRALGLPIVRPKSVTFKVLKSLAEKQA